METKANWTDKYFKYFLALWLVTGLFVAWVKDSPLAYPVLAIAIMVSVIFYYYRLKVSWDNAL